MATKLKRTLTLDPEVVAEFGADSAALSSAVNAVLLEEVARRRQRARLAEFVAHLEELNGSAGSDEVERFRQELAS
jgi:hypothetical protein